MVQYSGNAGMATCSKHLDAPCMSYILIQGASKMLATCCHPSIEVSPSLRLFKGALLPDLVM